MNSNQKIESIDEYIANFPTETQNILIKIRQIIHQTAPDATEKISYGIPTFFLNGNLIHFGAYPKHIGLYPGSKPIEDLKDKLKGYNTSKGTIQFQLNEPIPYGLIKKIVLTCISNRQNN